MAETDYPGIDYGLGMSNRDVETDIRYGVIAVNNLAHWAWEEFEAVYSCNCPSCGLEDNVTCEDEETGEDKPTIKEQIDEGNWEITCPNCGVEFSSDSAYGEEPVGYETYDHDGYILEIHTDGDLFVIKSPYVSRSQFCSPCAPGAGYLMNPCSDGPKTYCLGPEWFEDEECPYPYEKLAD